MHALATQEQLSLSQHYYTTFTQYHKTLVYRGMETTSEQQKKGVLVHDFLAQLEQFPTSEEEINRLLIPIAEKEKEMIRSALQCLAAHKELQELMDTAQQVWNEQTLITPTGEVLRPDKIVKTASETVVIDFKTGEERPEHQQQINLYCNALETMGHARVRGILLYI